MTAESFVATKLEDMDVTFLGGNLEVRLLLGQVVGVSLLAGWHRRGKQMGC